MPLGEKRTWANSGAVCGAGGEWQGEVWRHCAANLECRGRPAIDGGEKVRERAHDHRRG